MLAVLDLHDLTRRDHFLQLGVEIARDALGKVQSAVKWVSRGQVPHFFKNGENCFNGCDDLLEGKCVVQTLDRNFSEQFVVVSCCLDLRVDVRVVLESHDRHVFFGLLQNIQRHLDFFGDLSFLHVI